MSDYDVGYGKPPKHSRFKIGNRANLKGRPKRQALTAAELIDSGLNGTTQYTEGGRIKTASRIELAMKKTVNEALKGNLKAAETLLKLLMHVQRFGETGVQRFLMRNWQPDHPGQTGEQKTRQFAMRAEADAPEWWKDSDVIPPSEDS